MKGTIVKCLEGVVRERGGEAAWKQVLVAAGKPEHTLFSVLGVVPDADVHALITATAQVFGISEADAIEAFGFHWSTIYAPSVYPAYFERAKGARAFLLSLDEVHVAMTARVPDAAPPRFTYEDSDDTLVMHYRSSREMAHFMPGLIRGVGAYFKERLTVRRTGNALHVTFG